MFFWTSLQIQKPSRLWHSSAKFYFLYYPFTSLLPSLLTSWFGQPPATSCHDMPRLGPLLAGLVSIKWRGLTLHLHHNTIALWESRGIGAAESLNLWILGASIQRTSFQPLNLWIFGGFDSKNFFSTFESLNLWIWGLEIAKIAIFLCV